MSNTPIFDGVRAEWAAAAQSGYSHGRADERKEVLAILKNIAKPSKQVLDLIQQLEK